MGCLVVASVGRITGVGVCEDMLITVGVGLSSGASCMTNGRATTIWVGVAVNGIDVGGTSELLAWHPLSVSHSRNKNTALFFNCWMCLKVSTMVLRLLL